MAQNIQDTLPFRQRQQISMPATGPNITTTPQTLLTKTTTASNTSTTSYSATIPITLPHHPPANPPASGQREAADVASGRPPMTAEEKREKRRAYRARKAVKKAAEREREKARSDHERALIMESGLKVAARTLAGPGAEPEAVRVVLGRLKHEKSERWENKQWKKYRLRKKSRSRGRTRRSNGGVEWPTA